MKTDFKPFSSALYFWNGTASVFYSSDVTPLHYHNTLQLVFDLKGKFLFRTDHAQWEAYKSIIIREDVVHQLNTNQSLQLIIYIDATTKLAEKIKSKYLEGCDFCSPDIEFSPMEEVLFHENLINPKIKSLQLLIELILNRIEELTDTALTDERISKVLNLIKHTEADKLSIDYLAEKVFISPSRLRMQFKQQVGIPLHKYIIRNKILAVIADIINGVAIQEAAYKAGFNDSSHFNKLMLKIFDINPSAFLKENKTFSIIQDDTSFMLETGLVV